MDRFVARENIKHFQRLLEQTTDAAERVRLRKLLAEEEQKFKAAKENHGAEQPASDPRGNRPSRSN